MTLSSGRESSGFDISGGSKIIGEPWTIFEATSSDYGGAVSAVCVSTGNDPQVFGLAPELLGRRLAPNTGASESGALTSKSDWQNRVLFEGHYSMCARYGLWDKLSNRLHSCIYKHHLTLIASVHGLGTDV